MLDETRSMGGILNNTLVVGLFTLLSRFLGLGREMLQSRMIGAGMEQSAFTLAFAVPNMVRKLFGEGALTAAFVPVFRGELEKEGLEKAAKLARAVMTMMFLLLGAGLALIMTGTLVTLNLGDFSPRIQLVLSLSTILLPYMLAICGAAFGMGVLNAMGRFHASGFMPALLNIIWIAVLLGLVWWPDSSPASRIRLVAYAILFGGFVQFFYMMVRMRAVGVSPMPLFSGWKSEKVRLVWHNLGIAALGAGAIQVNYALDQFLAQVAAPWAAGVIGYAERLMDLPLGVIGVAFGTVLLPTFSGCFARNDLDAARETLAASVKNMMFLMIPAAVGLFALAPLVTAVVYEGGSFDAIATVRVSRALAVYASGLVFFGFQKVLIPWFQAQNDMRSPLRVSLITVCINAALNILSVWLLPEEFRHVGLAASTVLCSAIGCAILMCIAHRRNGELGLKRLVSPLSRIAAAAVIMGVSVYFIAGLLNELNIILAVIVLMAVGAAIYALLTLALGVFIIPKRHPRYR